MVGTSAMRVTSNTFTNDLIGQLGSLTEQQNRLQTQAATGQRITLPEDDPDAVGRVLDMQTEANAVAQYQTNINTQQQVSEATGNLIQSLKKISDRAGEIATAADGLKSPDELNAYAAEVSQLIQQAVQLGNTKNNGSYLLAGTRSDQPPFVQTTAPDGTVTGVSYQGNTSLSENEVAEGITLTAQTLGANTSGSGPRGLITDSRVGADFFSHLISLQQHLASGDTASIAATDRSQLASDEDNLIYQIAANGAVQSRLETSASMAQSRASSLQKVVSGEADADLAQTLVKLSQTQTAYQAALQTGAKVLNLSLLDYLQ
jgi:flagellar hook-associated protein 3 FlgL